MGSPLLAHKFLVYSTTRFPSTTTDSCPEESNVEIFDTTALQGITDIRASPGRCTCRLPVAPRIQNRNGMLHGGCTATIVDVVGTAALLTLAPRGGVSLTINTNYLTSMPGGSGCVVFIDAQVLRVGRTIAVVQVDLRNDANGVLVAQGTHVKFISSAETDLGKLLVSGGGGGGDSGVPEAVDWEKSKNTTVRSRM